MSQHQKEIEEGIFGKRQDIIAYEHPEGGDTGKNANKVGGAAFNREEVRVGGAAYDKAMSPSTDGEIGLYEGPRLAASTGSAASYIGEGGSQKRLIKNGKKNEANTRISLSMSDDDSEPQYNVQHLYDKTLKNEEGGEILPQKA